MIDKKQIEADGGMLRWMHDTDYGFRYVLTIHVAYNYIEFDAIRLSDHRKVYGRHFENKRWEDAVSIFETAQASILDPESKGHAAIQRNAAKYYPEF